MWAMRRSTFDTKTFLLGLGLMAFLVVVLSIVDMFRPRPFDGIVLDPDSPEQLRVERVVPGSGAELAGIRAGDRVLGIANNAVSNRRHAFRMLEQLQGNHSVRYLIETDRTVREVEVELGKHRVGGPSYFFACVLGFAFFFVGLFVLLRQPRLRASQVFFVVCTLFLLFLVCRLRPASYSQVDTFVLHTGTAALLLLPASFLHFFLIFPRPVLTLTNLSPAQQNHLWQRLLITIYMLPPVVLALSLMVSRWHQQRLPLISGSPIANWWVLALYMVLGLGVLAHSAYRLTDPREQRGAGLVFAGALFGLVPFLLLVVAFPSLLHTDRFLYLGIAPLALVPLTFAYAIVRFQLLDIRVILRKGLLYTLTTAVVTSFYALGIAFFNNFFSGTRLSSSRLFPLFFALAIVLLFEPLRRRIQGPIDRFFVADRSRLQRAMVRLGEALTGELDPQRVVRELVEQLPQQLDLHFAALYLNRNSRLERIAGPPELPIRLPVIPELERFLDHRQHKLTPLYRLEPLAASSPDVSYLIHLLSASGVEVLGKLASPRRHLGLVLLSGRRGQMALESSDLELLGGLLSQAAIALETGLLLQERTRQAELERELQIASSIQTSLLPGSISLAPRWQAAAVCRPAQDVGGDFFTQLPGPHEGTSAIVYGDVAGKSVSGALMMMAAHEVLHALAMTNPQPEPLLDLANRRLYQLRRRNFVALGYLTVNRAGTALRYALAGQPQPLLRRRTGEVQELDLPPHRLPLGALNADGYTTLKVPVAVGDLVLAYSDGVVDTCAPSGEFFGLERLCNVLAECPSEPSAAIRQILAALDDFAGGHPPYDDLTLVAIRRYAER